MGGMTGEPMDAAIPFLLKAIMGEPVTRREKYGGPYTHSFDLSVTHWPTPEEHKEMQRRLDDWFAVQEECRDDEDGKR